MALNLDLTHATALVTGATRGIGRSTASSLARAGAAVVIADLDKQQTQAVAAEIRADGHRALAVQLDVTDRDSVRRCVKEAIGHYERVDILVNNAGIFPGRLGLELQDDEFERCLDVNVVGIWRMVQALAPQLKAQGGGRIVNIASVAGRRGRAHEAAYGASKAAVINLTQGLAAILGPHKVNVNAICPGGIATDMATHIHSLLLDSPFQALLQQQVEIPMAGPLSAEDIAHAVVFFASDFARHITGQSLNVDCGYCMS